MRLPAAPGGGALGTLRRPGEAMQYAGLIGASAVAAGILTLAAYLASPVIALALPFAVAIAVLVCMHPMAGVYLAVLAVPLERVAVPAGAAAELTPAKALLVFVALVAIVRYLVEGRSRGLHRIQLAFLGVVLSMAVGIASAPEAFTVTKLVVEWAAFLVVAILISGSDRVQLERLFICIAVSGGILGAIAATTSSSQTLVEGGQAATGRAQAGFAHPAVLAFYLVLAFPPSIALALGGRPALRGLGIACAALAAAGIMFSLTRGAIIALAVSLLVLLLWAPFRRWAIALLCVVLVFSVFNARAISQSPQLEVIATRIGTISQGSQATEDNQRPYIWARTPKMIIDHPFFGVGAGEYSLYAPAYAIVGYGGEPFLHAHNVVLTVAAETGLIGAGFLLWMGFAIVAAGVRMVVRGRGHPAYPYAIATSAALAGSFTTGMIDYPPGTVVIMGMIMVVVGAFIATERLLAKPAEPEPS